MLQLYIKNKILIIIPLFIILACSSIYPQNTPGQPLRFTQQDYPRGGERYVTDQYGVIRMWVNVWGHVENPGSYLVYDGIDLPTLLSITGGPKTGANLKKVSAFREVPDENGKLSYKINMKEFLKEGDRSELIKILPNDTYIVPQTIPSYVLSHVGIVNTLMSAMNLYYLALLRREQAR
jgi:hypothetical protein